MHLPPALTTTFQGNAQAFQDSLSTVPLLILAALVVVYLILGVLYESFIHPLTILSTLPSAGFGALATLDAVRLRVQPDRPDRHHPADRHRQEERHHDGRLRHRRRARRASVDRAVDPQGCAAALPSDHDDDDGGHAGRRAVDAGHGAPARNSASPLGYAMVGGLLVSQALTLFTTPVIYIYLDRLSKWLSGGRRRRLRPEAAVDAGDAAWADGRRQAAE